MKKLDKWAADATSYFYEENTHLGFLMGAREMRDRIFHIIKLTDEMNAEKIKEDPKLATFLLLELSEKIKMLGEENAGE